MLGAVEHGVAAKGVLDHETELAQSARNDLRLFVVKHHVSTTPVSDVEGSWAVCDPKSAADFSAVGYFFGKALSEDIKSPVGLIESSWGGTAQVWTSLDGLKADVLAKDRYWLIDKDKLKDLDKSSETFEKEWSKWKAAGDQSSSPPAVPKISAIHYCPDSYLTE